MNITVMLPYPPWALVNVPTADVIMPHRVNPIHNYIKILCNIITSAVLDTH